MQKPGLYLRSEEKTLEKWAEIHKSFVAYYTILGRTEEEKERAVRRLKWEPEKQSFEEFLLKYRAMMEGLKDEISEARKLTLFIFAMPQELCSMLINLTDVESAVKTVTRAIGMGMVKALQSQDTVYSVAPNVSTRLLQELEKFLSVSNADKRDGQEQQSWDDGQSCEGRDGDYGWKGGCDKYDSNQQQQNSDEYWGGCSSGEWDNDSLHNSAQDSQPYYCKYCQRFGHSTRKCKSL